MNKPPFNPNEPFETASAKPEFDPNLPHEEVSEKPAFDPSKPFEDAEEKYGSTSQQLISGLEGAAKAVTFGLSSGVERALGVNPEDIKAREEVNPISHGVGEAAGLIGSAFIPVYGTANILGRTGQAVAEVASLGKIGSAAIKGAVEAGLFQGGSEISDALLGYSDPNKPVSAALANMGAATLMGGLTGGVFGTAGAGLAKISDSSIAEKAQKLVDNIGHQMRKPEDMHQMRPIMKKILSTFGGVAEKDIDDYLANRDAIQNTPGFQEIYNNVLDHIGNLADNVAEGKINREIAERNFSDFGRTLREQLKDQQYSASEANRIAKKMLGEASTKFKVDIYEKAAAEAPKISNAVNELRDSVIKQSQAAYEVLNNSDKSISLKPIFSKIETMISDIESEKTGMAEQQAAALKSYWNNLWKGFSNPDEITGLEAKKLIQGLDKVSKYDFNAAEFDKGMSKYFTQIRYEIDDALKDANPAYREAMKPLAKDAKLLGKLAKYGTDEDAIKSIGSLKSATKYNEQISLLKDLEKRSGIKFIENLDPYANPEVRERLFNALPENKKSDETAELLRKLKDPIVKRELEQTIANSPESLAVKESRENLNNAQMAQKGLGGLTPFNLEARLKSYSQGKGIANKSLFEDLRLGDKSVGELLELTRMAEAFNKSATRGSKHVNLYGGIIGGLSGLAGGLPGAGIGVPVGAVAGAAIDNYGPSIVKRILDAHLDGVVGKGINPYVRAAALKALSNDAAGAVPEAIRHAKNVERGTKQISNAMDALFAVGSVKSLQFEHKEKDREKLRKFVEEGGLPIQIQNSLNAPTVKKEPQRFAEGGLVEQPITPPNPEPQPDNKLSQVFPEQEMLMQTAKGRIFNYLNSQRPLKTGPTLPFDSMPEDKQKVRSYDDLLDMANQPLSILKNVQDGKLTPDQLKHFSSMYPELYSHLSQEMTKKVVDLQMKGEKPNYSIRQSLSLFLGAPLDSSFTPQSIMAAQNVFASKKQQQAQNQPQAQVKKGTTGMSDMYESRMTNDQGRQLRQAEG